MCYCFKNRFSVRLFGSSFLWFFHVFGVFGLRLVCLFFFCLFILRKWSLLHLFKKLKNFDNKTQKGVKKLVQLTHALIGNGFFGFRSLTRFFGDSEEFFPLLNACFFTPFSYFSVFRLPFLFFVSVRFFLTSLVPFRWETNLNSVWVSVCGSSDGAAPLDYLMHKDPNGVWETTLFLNPGPFVFHFNVAGKPHTSESLPTQIHDGVTKNVIRVD